MRWSWAQLGHKPPGRLLDHLIRPRQRRRRDRQAESLGGLEVDDQLELGWLLDGQVSGLRALEDPIHEVGGVPELFWIVWAVLKSPPASAYSFAMTDNGSRCVTARSAMRRRSENHAVFSVTMTASARAFFIATKAASRSFGLRTPTICTVTPKVFAALSTTRSISVDPRLSGFRRRASRESCGINCLRRSTRFAASS